MTVIRKAADIAAASSADLVETYNALTGSSIKKFETRKIAERRVEMALLAATDAAGHAGVAPNTAPVPATVEELAEKAASNPYKEGTMSHSLHEACEKAAPIVPRPKKAEAVKAGAAPAAAPRKFSFVRPTFAGTSKVQANSNRAAVLACVNTHPEGVTVEALDAYFCYATRGYLQKLIEKNHVVPVEQVHPDQGALDLEGGAE